MSNLLSDPDAMRDYAGRFHQHATVIDDEARKAWSSSQSIAGAGWNGHAQTTSAATLEEMMRAFRNIHDMTQHVSDNLTRSAQEYEDREHVSGQSLST